MPDVSPEFNRTPRTGSVGTGCGVTALLNFIGLILGIRIGSSASATVGTYMLLGIGIVQVLWLYPLWWKYRREGKTETAKGVLIGAGITFLLNAGCWGLIGLGSRTGISG